MNHAIDTVYGKYRQFLSWKAVLKIYPTKMYLILRYYNAISFNYNTMITSNWNQVFEHIHQVI